MVSRGITGASPRASFACRADIAPNARIRIWCASAGDGGQIGLEAEVAQQSGPTCANAWRLAQVSDRRCAGIGGRSAGDKAVTRVEMPDEGVQVDGPVDNWQIVDC